MIPSRSELWASLGGVDTPPGWRRVTAKHFSLKYHGTTLSVYRDGVGESWRYVVSEGGSVICHAEGYRTLEAAVREVTRCAMLSVL